MRRCGVAPGEPALALAREVGKYPNLRFGGLQAYHGRAQHMRGMDERHGVIETAAQHVFHTKKLLEKAGIACPIVTGAGSGTFMFEVESGAWDEIQCGSYAFMDVDYAPQRMGRAAAALRARALRLRHGDEPAVGPGGDRRCRPQSFQRRFRHAGRVAAAGPRLYPRLRRARLGGGAEAVPALGEKMLLLPGHCDPTINLYDWYVCVRNGRVEALWPITARGAVY